MGDYPLTANAVAGRKSIVKIAIYSLSVMGTSLSSNYAWVVQFSLRYYLSSCLLPFPGTFWPYTGNVWLLLVLLSLSLS
jgi:hypothetical protein